MKLANMHLVTGYAGFEHVSAVDMGAFNVAMLGSGQWVINKGNKLAATIVTNNKIRIKDGEIYMQGRHIRLNSGSTVDLAIENGKSGYLRNDLIVARYTKNAETGVEEVNLAVIKGTAVTSDPVDPAYTSGNITEGKVNLNDMPLYRVPLNGLNVQKLVPLFEVKSWMIPNTAMDIGAIPVIDATDESDDMDVILQSGAHLAFYQTDGDTKNTPYAKGAVPSNFKRALIMSYSGLAQNGFQIAFPNGQPYMLTRSYNAGTIANEGNWIKVYSESCKPTAEAVGLGNVPNVTTNNQTPTFTQAEALANLKSGEALSLSMGKIMKAIADLISHLGDTKNPHDVTAEQVGARPDDWMPNAEQVGARPDDWMPNAEQVGARPDDWMPNAEQVGARPDDWMPTAEEVNALPIINAQDSKYKMDDIIKQGKHFAAYYTNSSTDGTPSKKGDVPSKFQRALILSYSGATVDTGKEYGFQLALPNGLPYMMTRRMEEGAFGDEKNTGKWFKLYSEENPPTAEEVGAARIEYGSYVGTGTYGEDNPTEITFSFVPKMVWVWRQNAPNAHGGGFSSMSHAYMIPCFGLTDQYSNAGYLPGLLDTWKNKLVSTTLCFSYSNEYDTAYGNAARQLNTEGVTYYYIAIG